ncbi:MAG: SAM-dependent methyltransferase [Limisphaerales bacterium]
MIRTALPDDALAIHNLHTRSVRRLCMRDYPKEVIEAWLLGRSPEGYKGIGKKEMYVFEEGGVIRGFSHVVPMCIVALFVDPDHTRSGVGRALFEHALALIRASGTVPVPFEATITALPFYLKMGCTEIRRSFVEKNQVKVETVLMRLPGKINHASEPTALAVTPTADAPVAPTGGRGSASRTALATAYLRAAHQLLDAPPRVLEDLAAVRLLGKDASQNICQAAERYRSPETSALRSHVVLRSRFAEDRLAAAVQRGASQYVILGAGFDTFAFRQPDWARSLKIFEIDHRDTQLVKRSFLTRADLDLPANVRFAQIDFEHESLLEGLCRNHVSVEEPTFFSWLGVTVYLREAAIDAALKSMATFPSGSEVVLTFKQPMVKPAGQAAEAAQKLAENVASVGEPFISFFEPKTMEAKLTGAGFSKVEFLDLETAGKRYFALRPADLPRPKHVNIVSGIR